MAHSRPASAITLEGARTLVAAGRAEARRRGWTVAIAVVDPAGDLVAFERIDGTQPASQGIAIAKARTAARFRRPTRALEEAVASGRAALLSIDPEAVLLDGGLPITEGDQVIGAIGVSGMTSAQDGEVAAAALKALSP